MKYKIVVFGTKQSTISLLDVIKHDVDLIVTIDNTTSHHISGKGDVGHYAEIEDINCYSTSDYSLKSCQDFFENNEFEIGISYGWQRLIPDYVLKRFKHGVFGTHASPLGLPYGKGRSPLNWSIIRGFDKWDTIDSIKMKDIIVTKKEVVNLIKDYKNDSIVLHPQRDDIEETFFPKRSPKDGKINLDWSCKDIYNLIRGVTRPFPGAFLMCGDMKVTIWDAVPFDNQLDFSDYVVGDIIKWEGDKFILKLVDNTLLVNDFDCEDLHKLEEVGNLR